jgi:hypothetical protein
MGTHLLKPRRRLPRLCAFINFAIDYSGIWILLLHEKEIEQGFQVGFIYLVKRPMVLLD